MQNTTDIPASEILKYCKFPPEWGASLSKNNPYADIRVRVNHEGGYFYEVPTELVNEVNQTIEN